MIFTSTHQFLPIFTNINVQHADIYCHQNLRNISQSLAARSLRCGQVLLVRPVPQLRAHQRLRQSWSVIMMIVMSSDNLGPSLPSHLLILSVCQKEMENGECCRIVLFYLWSDKRLIVKRGTIWHIIRRANFQLKIKNCRGLGDEGGERGRGRWGGQNLLRRPHARRDVGEG